MATVRKCSMAFMTDAGKKITVSVTHAKPLLFEGTVAEAEAIISPVMDVIMTQQPLNVTLASKAGWTLTKTDTTKSDDE